MKYIIFFILIPFTIPTAFGQLVEKEIICDTECGSNLSEPKECCGYVIALSGLRIRENPSLNAKVITTIPFRSQVIRKKVYFKKSVHGFIENNQWSQDSVPGNWELLEWNGIQGYGFNAFIGNSPINMENDYYLLFEDESWCSDDGYASLSYHYYGVFINGDTTVTELKSFKPTFYRAHNDVNGTLIKADEKKKTQFVLISKNPMTEGAIKIYKNFKPIYTNIVNGRYVESPVVNKIKIPSSNWMLESKKDFVTLNKNDTTRSECIILILRDVQSGITQSLGVFNEPNNTISINWCGDLDRDGVPDFMIGVYSDYSVGNLLFLSSNPGKGKLVRFACQYYWSDCC